MPSPRFECDRCGLCCRLIGNVPQLMHFDRGDGVCVHLTPENLCDIYEGRPEVCSVERMYSRFSSQLTKEEYLEAMMRSCAILKSHYRGLRSTMSANAAAGECGLEGLGADFEQFRDSLPKGTLDEISGEVLAGKVKAGHVTD